MTGDGNCFFRALAKQVYLDEQEHGRARQETIRYMRDRREEFDQFVHGVDFDSYVDLMSIEGTYIEGQVEIKAAANAFNVRIKVYGRSKYHDRTIAPLFINSETRDVYMAHYQAAQHYVVLEQMDPAPTARGGLSRSMSASGGLNSSNSSRARRQDSRGTPQPLADQRQATTPLNDTERTARGGPFRSMSASVPNLSLGTPPRYALPDTTPRQRPALTPINDTELRRRLAASRGTPTASRLPPASARAPGEIVLEMATPLGRPRDELDA